jgi:hypothetical protein
MDSGELWPHPPTKKFSLGVLREVVESVPEVLDGWVLPRVAIGIQHVLGMGNRVTLIDFRLIAICTSVPQGKHVHVRVGANNQAH